MNSRCTDEAKVYRKAAERLFSMQHPCCCHALLAEGGETAEFVANFHPTGKLCEPIQWSEEAWIWGVIDNGENKEAIHQRCLALCFMAAMVEAGDA
jgi:hypothetical protein